MIYPVRSLFLYMMRSECPPSLSVTSEIERAGLNPVFLLSYRLFLLVTVLSETFFALVGSHLVAFSFLSAGHFTLNLKVNILFNVISLWRLFHIVHEHACGLESGDFVFGDDDSCVLGNVACCLFRAGLHDEATETAKIYVFAMSEGVFNNFHEFFDSFKNVGFLDAGAF